MRFRAADVHPVACFARQIHLAHIFIALPANATPEATRQAESKANAAWARLLGGEAFGVVAKDASQDPATSERGGDLGVVKEGQVDPAIFEAAAALKAGEFSKPVRTPFGLHLLEAVSAVEKTAPRFEEVKGQVGAALRRTAESALREQVAKDISVTRYPEHLAQERHP